MNQEPQKKAQKNSKNSDSKKSMEKIVKQINEKTIFMELENIKSSQVIDRILFIIIITILSVYMLYGK